MSASPWLKESRTGRFYVNWQNEHGETVRRYSEELSGGSTANQPTYEEENDKPRSELSTQSLTRVEYGATSSRYSTSTGQRARRESMSYNRAPDPLPEQSDRSNSRPIYSRSRSGYHDQGGYDEPRNTRPVKTYDEKGSPTFSLSSHTSRRQYASGQATRYEDEDEDEDGLSLQAKNLTLYKTEGDRNYTTVSASAPVRRGRWEKLETRDEAARALILEDQRGKEQPTRLRSPARERSPFRDPSRVVQQDKGKSVATDLPEPLSTIVPSERRITSTPSDAEDLDESYRVRNYDWQKFFRPGRVFSTLWTDAFAGTTNESENQFMSSVSYVIYKQRVHSKIRRFVVVRLGDRCCTCLPVTTYNGNGYRKRGINLSEHGLIYSGEKKPAGVKGIEKHPLRVKLSKGADKLNNSYINYGRVYTVETNVKVKDVGELDSESRKYLRTYYNEVNTLPDEDYDIPGPARDPQARAVELAGVGGGLSGSSFSTVPGSHTSSHAQLPAHTSSLLGPASTNHSDYNTAGQHDRSSSYNQYGSQWPTTSVQYAPSQVIYSAPALYNPSGSPAISTGRYPQAPTYDMHRTPSSSNYQSADGRYVPSTSSHFNTSMYPSNPSQRYGPSDHRPAQRVAVSPSNYPSGTIIAANDPYSQRDAYSRKEEFSSSQNIEDRLPPLDSSGGRDPYSSGSNLVDRQGIWISPQQRLDPSYVESTYVESSYASSQSGEKSIELPTLEEARASKTRRESASGRTHGSSHRDRDKRRR